jgi:Xaa-Pro dipeptidase
MGGFLDRGRAQRLMDERGLDALLLIQPESISYASGAHPSVAASWRRAGAAMVLVSADAGEPLAAIVGDL